MTINIEEDIEVPADKDLSRVAALGKRLLFLQNRVLVTKKLLKEAEEDERVCRETDLPDTMLNLGVKSFTLDSGEEIAVVPFFKCSLAGKYMAAAIAWLKRSGNDGLIKRDVVVSVAKGEEESANALVAKLRTFGWEPVVLEEVHTGSFKSAIKELAAKGKLDVPLEEVGVYMGSEAKVIVPK